MDELGGLVRCTICDDDRSRWLSYIEYLAEQVGWII